MQKKQCRRLIQIAYYQAGKIVVQTLLPQHPPVALITLNFFGVTSSTSADTHIPIDSTQCCASLETRLIGLYGGKASSLLFEYQILDKCIKKGMQPLHTLLCKPLYPSAYPNLEGVGQQALNPEGASEAVGIGGKTQNPVFTFGILATAAPFLTEAKLADLPLNSLAKRGASQAGGKGMQHFRRDTKKARLLFFVPKVGKPHLFATGNNPFHSDLGNMENQAAHQLAATMVKDWNFYSIDIPILAFGGTGHPTYPEGVRIHFSEGIRRREAEQSLGRSGADGYAKSKRNSFTKMLHILPPASLAPSGYEEGNNSTKAIVFYQGSTEGKQNEFSENVIDKNISFRANQPGEISSFSNEGTLLMRNQLIKNWSSLLSLYPKGVVNSFLFFKETISQSKLIPTTSYLRYAQRGNAKKNFHIELHILLSPILFYVASQTKNSFQVWNTIDSGDNKFSYNKTITSIENIGEKLFLSTDVTQLINPLHFSNGQRNRFYPGWFRLYLPDIEATEFFKNVANYYFSLGLQTLTRSSSKELIRILYANITEHYLKIQARQYFPSVYLQSSLCYLCAESQFVFWFSKQSVPKVRPAFIFSKNSTSGSKIAELTNPQYDRHFSYISSAYPSASEGSKAESTYPYSLPHALLRGERSRGVGQQIPSPPLRASVTGLPSEYAEDAEHPTTLGLPPAVCREAEQRFSEDAFPAVRKDVFPAVRKDAFPAVRKKFKVHFSTQESDKDKRKLKNPLISASESKHKESGTIDTRIGFQKESINFMSQSSLVVPSNGIDSIFRLNLKTCSFSLIKKVFFCCGDNNLSIGIGLLRNAAKRRSQLNIKNLSVDYVTFGTQKAICFTPTNHYVPLKQHSYPTMSMVLWGLLKPWKMNRFVNIDFRQIITDPIGKGILEARNMFQNINVLHLKSQDPQEVNNAGISGLSTLYSKGVLDLQSWVTQYTLPAFEYPFRIPISPIPPKKVQKACLLRFHTKGKEPLLRSPHALLRGIGLAYPSGMETKQAVHPTAYPKGKPAYFRYLNPEGVDQQATDARRDLQSRTSEGGYRGNSYAKQTGGLYWAFKDKSGIVGNKKIWLQSAKKNLLIREKKQCLHLFQRRNTNKFAIEKEFLFHALINNCFIKSFYIVNQNRQLIDYFVDYLIRFQILRQHQILYIFSTLLLTYKK